MNAADIETIKRAVRQHQDEAVGLLQEMVRIPSVNHPPGGDERQVQEFYLRHLESLGLDCEMFEADDVPGFAEHPGRSKEHDMANRPDVVGVRKGGGSGRSILLIAHADVELPGDSALWTDNDPFSGAVRDGRVYGRGAGDDKSGMAINAMVPRILEAVGVRLHGDLTVASVSDEEQGGANGTVALLAKGYKADACIYVDGCNQDLCASNLGGGRCDIDITVAPPQHDATELLAYFDGFRRAITEFKEIRRKDLNAHRHYATDEYGNISIRLMNISLGVDDVSHGTFTVRFYLLPGEEPEPFKKQFSEFLEGVVGAGSYRMQWTQRPLPASQIDQNHPFVGCLGESFALSTGRAPSITGSSMSDMGIVNQYGGFPCIIFGPSRMGTEGMVHQPDEFVDIAEFMECLETVVLCTMKWCGYERTQ